MHKDQQCTDAEVSERADWAFRECYGLRSDYKQGGAQSFVWTAKTLGIKRRELVSI